MRIIHYTNRGGRYGNQIIQFAHWIAFAEEFRDVEVAYLPFWTMHRQAAGTLDNPYCIYPFDPVFAARPGVTLRALHALFSHPKRARFNLYALDRLCTSAVGRRHLARLPASATSLADSHFVSVARSLRRTLWVGGNHYRDWTLLEKHQSAVRAFLRPPVQYDEEADRFLRPMRDSHATLVGLFIRQGDYSGWYDGRFYFPTDVYLRLLAQLNERFSGLNPCFVIASETQQDEAAFKGLPCVFAPGQATGPGNYLVNVATLSKCDYVVTVPSTSGVLPAFFGSVPIIAIREADADLRTVPVLENHLFDCVDDEVMNMSIR